MKAGSLCTGYGGLDLAVDALLGTETVWLSEFDTHAATVAEARFPGVPNLGDLTTVDWAAVEAVEVLTAGYPCQPFSHAGRRKGTDDPRHIWPHIARAISVLGPGLVVLENVAGHLALGFDSVLGDLADLGFDAEWCLVRASDVGACHQRKRLFIVATDTAHERCERVGAARGWRHGPAHRGADVPDTAGEGPQGLRPQPAGRGSEPGGQRPAAHADGPVAGPDPGGSGAAAPAGPGCRERWGREPGPVECGDPAPDAERDGRSRRDDTGSGEGLGAAGSEPARTHPAVAWGDYEPAIRRHQHVIGRHAPSPVDDKGRLSPRFVEWMMMLPDGWVTNLPLSRAQALKILGNGVVPPQAAYAISHLLQRDEMAA